jgi:hypothetical protein
VCVVCLYVCVRSSDSAFGISHVHKFTSRSFSVSFKVKKRVVQLFDSGLLYNNTGCTYCTGIDPRLLHICTSVVWHFGEGSVSIIPSRIVWKTGAASANSKDTEKAVRVNVVTTPENTNETSDLTSHTERQCTESTISGHAMPHYYCITIIPVLAFWKGGLTS